MQALARNEEKSLRVGALLAASAMEATIGMFGMFLFYLIVIAERFIIPWHVSHRATFCGEN